MQSSAAPIREPPECLAGAQATGNQRTAGQSRWLEKEKARQIEVAIAASEEWELRRIDLPSQEELILTTAGPHKSTSFAGMSAELAVTASTSSDPGRQRFDVIRSGGEQADMMPTGVSREEIGQSQRPNRAGDRSEGAN